MSSKTLVLYKLKKMKQYYAKYTDWEDYKNGMYSKYNVTEKEVLIQKSVDLLKDCSLFYNTMILILNEWKVSAKVNMTNLDSNRMAWLGQAACSYNHKSPEVLTRVAWGKLSEVERVKANNTANKIIKKYEREYRRLHNAMESQGVLF